MRTAGKVSNNKGQVILPFWPEALNARGGEGLAATGEALFVLARCAQVKSAQLARGDDEGKEPASKRIYEEKRP